MTVKENKNKPYVEVEKPAGGKENPQFIRILEKYNIRNEGQFLHFGKWVLFVLIVFMELLIVLQHLELTIDNQNWDTFVALMGLVLTLTVVEIAKNFVQQSESNRWTIYIIEALATCSFLSFSEGVYALVLYMLVLTQFYIGAQKFRTSLWMFVTSIPLFMLCYVLQVQIWQGINNIRFVEALRETFGAILALSMHFLSVQICLTFYKQYLQLSAVLKELSENKQELEKAYSVVAEVTALEERQRIAKEIHDTAGHSLTTVIMQTEAAKRLIEKQPEEAKHKIIAANLQAKHALEELRESVHILSGAQEEKTLKDDLENVIHESTDGTGICIRSAIEDISVSKAKHRFLCNTLKEGISNGLRHGGASAFWFELKIYEEKIRFLLSDNGKGLGGKALAAGYGLTTMKERVKSFGGEIYFESAEDEGFEIRLIMPLDKGE